MLRFALLVPIGPTLTAIPLTAAVPFAALVLHWQASLPGVGARALAALLGLAALALAARRRGAGAHGLRWLGVAVLAFAAFAWRAELELARRIGPDQEGREMRASGVVESLPQRYERGFGFRFLVETCDWLPGPKRGGARRSVAEPPRDAEPVRCPAARSVRLGWYRPARSESAPMPAPGERWSFAVRLKRPHALQNPGGFDGELRALEEGIAALGYVSERAEVAALNRRVDSTVAGVGLGIERARLATRERMVQRLDGVEPAVLGTLVALVLGDQAAIPRATWSVYQRTGVGHLMSISGLHITMLAGAVIALARVTLRHVGARMPRLLARVPAPLLCWLPGVATAFAYSAFAGWGIPAQRTCWMLAAVGLALLTGRTTSIVHVLAFAAAVVVVFDPWAPGSAGFWLSFAAVAAIVLFGSEARRRRRSWLADVAGTQWAATVVTAPLGALFFASFPLVGPLANAVAIPVVSAIVTPLALCGAGLLYVLPSLGEPALHLAGWCIGLLLTGLRWLAGLPGAVLAVPGPGVVSLACAIAGVAILLSPLRRAPIAAGGLLLLPLAFVAPPRPPSGEWRITALDIGQGSALLVETRRHRLLYDAGPRHGTFVDAGTRVVVPFLRAQGVASLDRLLVSHADDDHAGGASAVLDEIATLATGGSLPAAHPLRTRRGGFEPCRRGQHWVWDGVRFEVLWPLAALDPRDAAATQAAGVSTLAGPDASAAAPGTRGRRRGNNGTSCVLRVVAKSGTALLTGDIERTDEVELAAAGGLRADVLVAPHHGSRSSSSAALLDAVGARDVIVQAGYRNRFGHPAGEVLARYREAGLRLWRTDADGAIVAVSGGDQPALAAWRARDRRYWRLAMPTGRSSRRRSTNWRREPGRRPGCTGRPRARRSARESRIPPTAASPTAARPSRPRVRCPGPPRARRSVSARAG